MLLLPYLTEERKPNLPQATGTITGVTMAATPDALLRASLDGVAAGLAYCLDALARQGITAPDVTLTGGGSAHPAWRQAIADATGLRVTVREGSEHAARGAAMQAVAVVRGEAVADVVARWRPAVTAEVAPRPGIREAFRLEERRRLIEERTGAGQDEVVPVLGTESADPRP